MRNGRLVPWRPAAWPELKAAWGCPGPSAAPKVALSADDSVAEVEAAKLAAMADASSGSSSSQSSSPVSWLVKPAPQHPIFQDPYSLTINWPDGSCPACVNQMRSFVTTKAIRMATLQIG